VRGDLQSARLHLRAPAPSDERLYCALYTDPHVMRHVATPLSPEAAQRAFRTVLRQLAADPPQAQYWILVPRTGRAALGLMACMPDRDDPGSAEVGVLLRGHAEGQGYAAEALAALANEAFAAPGLQCLRVRHARGNGLAAGLMRKLGFAPVDDARGDDAHMRWELQRQAWPLRAVFASPPPSC